MSKDLFGKDGNGAEFSDDRKYRYALWRIWDDNKPLAMFIGLNPSTADESNPDNTITRVKSFAASWGFGGFYMMNCFAYVSTKPEDLEGHPNTALNDHWLYKVAMMCSEIIFCFGAFDIIKKTGRDKELIGMFPNAKCLVLNKDGSPRHPLYVKGDVKPIKYKT